MFAKGAALLKLGINEWRRRCNVDNSVTFGRKVSLTWIDSNEIPANAYFTLWHLNGIPVP